MKTSKRQTNRNQSRVANPAPPSLSPAVGFTLIELLVVIAIIGILAGLIVTLAGTAARAKKIKPTQTLLSEMEIAIESYKSAVGPYPYSNSSPPDFDNDGRVNVGGMTETEVLLPAMNPLFYELTGTVFDQRTMSYTSTQGGDGLLPQQCELFFGKNGLENTTTNPDKTKSFIGLEDGKFAPISAQPAVNLLLAPVKWPKNTNDVALEQYRPVRSNNPEWRMLNPWQYRAPGRHNSKSFDLWADFPIGKKVYRIGNWGKREPEVINENN